MYVSVFVFIWAIFLNRDLEREPLFGVWIFNKFFFGIGAWIGLVFFLQGGFENALSIIPESWGYFSEGDWQSYREEFAFFFALTASIFIAGFIEKKWGVNTASNSA